MTDTATMERPSTDVVGRQSAEISAAPLTIEQTIRAQYAAIEPQIVALAERHRDVVFDVSTPSGLADAKAARHELREQGRFFLNRALDGKKREVNDGKKLMEAETERLVGIIRPVEDGIDKLITDREKVLAEEKAERERAAAARREKFEAEIAKIRACADRCAGLPAFRIANGIALVEAMAFGDDWAEFARPAAVAQAETLTTMRRLHGEAVEAERLAAEAEARRVEQERVAAEQRAEAARLQAEREKFEAERREFERQQAEAAAKLKAAEAPPAPAAEPAPAPAPAASAFVAGPAPQPAQQTIDEVAARSRPLPGTASAPAPTVEEAVAPATAAAPAADSGPGPVEFAAAPAPASDEPPIALGEICRRLGFTVTGEFVIGLGLTPLESKGRAVLFPASVWPSLKDALIAHIEGLQ